MGYEIGTKVIARKPLINTDHNFYQDYCEENEDIVWARKVYGVWDTFQEIERFVDGEVKEIDEDGTITKDSFSLSIAALRKYVSFFNKRPWLVSAMKAYTEFENYGRNYLGPYPYSGDKFYSIYENFSIDFKEELVATFKREREDFDFHFECYFDFYWAISAYLSIYEDIQLFLNRYDHLSKEFQESVQVFLQKSY